MLVYDLADDVRRGQFCFSRRLRLRQSVARMVPIRTRHLWPGMSGRQIGAAAAAAGPAVAKRTNYIRLFDRPDGIRLVPAFTPYPAQFAMFFYR